MPVLLDFESRSRADLKAVGGRRYWADPTTEALCCVLYDTDTGALEVWRRGGPAPSLRGAELGAHNAMGFDRFAADRLGWRRLGEGPAWIDTAELARSAGLPGSLDALAQRWTGRAKDKVASRYTNALSSVRRPKTLSADDWRAMSPGAKRCAGVLPGVTPAVLDRVEAYCLSDVEIMVDAWDRLAPLRGLDIDGLQDAERAVNDRGIAFDGALAKALLVRDASNSRTVIRECAETLGWTQERVRETASSPAQFVEATGAPDATAETVDAILSGDPFSPPHALATARRALASIARGKLVAGLVRTCPDGRLRDSHLYYGAHTGRWSQRGMQLHNLPRPTDAVSAMPLDEIGDSVRDGAPASPDLIAALVRGTLHAPEGSRLVVCDFSGVEARGLAWAANDYSALDTFAGGRDPYRVMAAQIFGVPYDSIAKGSTMRTVGKIAELACGYQMGANKFAATAQAAGADLAEHGVDAAGVVTAWRALHKPIVRFWRALQDGFLAVAQGGLARAVGPVTFRATNDATGVVMRLPSGRDVWYPEVRVSDGDFGPSVSYLSARGRSHLYGGKLAENAIQALCRDLLAEALVTAHLAGLDVVLHVHDELVIETPTAQATEVLAVIKRVMSSPPEWARGFPLACEGFVCRRYRK